VYRQRELLYTKISIFYNYKQ